MPTIGSTLALSAERFPDRPALVFGDRRLSYRELDDEVNRTANALTELGLRKGDRFALMATNSDRFVVAFYAAAKLGALFVPVNPRSAPPEVVHIVEDCGATVLAVDPALLSTVDAAYDPATGTGTGTGPTVVALSPSPGRPDLVTLASAQPPHAPDVEVDERDDSLVVYTSGTTGRPKGALFDHHRTIWVGVGVMAMWGMADRERLLHVAPLYHSAELAMMLVPGTMVGATHVVHASFDAAAVLDTIETESITAYFGVPTMYQAIVQEQLRQPRALSTWRVGLYGAAPMPEHVVTQMIHALPGLDLYSTCGQTEAGPNGIYSAPEEVRERPSASGRRGLMGTQVRIVDAAGDDVAAGGTGELLIRSETVMKGYWNRPAETAETIRDGWLHTGDLAIVDEDGYITLVDRLKDMIITGGRNVYSIEVENAIAAVPGVAECAVVGRPDDRFGETIVAVVTPHDGAEVTLETIRAGAGEQIADYKLPRELVIATIPRNPSGKILKHQIRDQLWPAATS